MSYINIPNHERDALKTIDSELLIKFIRQSLDDERLDDLRKLRLESCGEYVYSHFRAYEKALLDYRSAKAAKKRSDMRSIAYKAGGDLEHAVSQMKSRVISEERDELLFRIDDFVTPPFFLNSKIKVRLSYSWRKTIDDNWIYGNITFSHDASIIPSYTTIRSTQKQSKAKQKQEEQDRLYYTWDRLKTLGLYSLKKYFQEGGDGSKIPEIFEAIPDSYSKHLNNHSADFWSAKS